MAIDTYGNLKTAVANYLNRSDLTSYIPDFITLALQRLNYGAETPFPSQPLRIPAMQEQDTGTIANGSIAFPTGFLEPIRVAVSSNGATWSLLYTPPERFSEVSNSTDLPVEYTYLDNAIKVPGSASSYTLDYYKAFTAFSADADTNWLLANAPGVMLYASLLEASPFLGSDDRIPGWHGMLKSSIAGLNRSTHRKAGGSLQVKVAR